MLCNHQKPRHQSKRSCFDSYGTVYIWRYVRRFGIKHSSVERYKYNGCGCGYRAYRKVRGGAKFNSPLTPWSSPSCSVQDFISFVLKISDKLRVFFKTAVTASEVYALQKLMQSSRTKWSETRNFWSHFRWLWEMNDAFHSSEFRERVQKTSKSYSAYVDQQFRQNRKFFKENLLTIVFSIWNSWTRRIRYLKYSTPSALKSKRVSKLSWHSIPHIQRRQADPQPTERSSSTRQLRPAHRRPTW